MSVKYNARCVGSCFELRFWICELHQLMLTSANTTPRPDCSSVPWFCGTSIVTEQAAPAHVYGLAPTML